jgi:hypothetical protein
MVCIKILLLGIGLMIIGSGAPKKIKNEQEVALTTIISECS